jgi:predicted SprT family Zn-dependent metalloprotease
MPSPIAARFARRAAARELAVGLMHRHDLAGWRFTFNRRKACMGLCHYERKTIELSIHLVDRNGPEEIRDTILHEIAHALVGPGHAHDSVWKRKCLEIGAAPRTCGQGEMPRGRWTASCGACGTSYFRHRKPARPDGWFCRACGPDKGALNWRMDRAPVLRTPGG